MNRRGLRAIEGGFASRETTAHCRAKLSELANAVRRLGPDRRDPETFHVEKDRIAAELDSLARESERRR